MLARAGSSRELGRAIYEVEHVAETELETIRGVDSQEIDAEATTFILSLRWLNSWLDFIFKGDEAPGYITNGGDLCDKRGRLKTKIKIKRDYRAVNFEVYSLFCGLYGTDCTIRCVGAEGGGWGAGGREKGCVKRECICVVWRPPGKGDVTGGPGNVVGSGFVVLPPESTLARKAVFCRLPKVPLHPCRQFYPPSLSLLPSLPFRPSILHHASPPSR
jgi:hypothetical protein